MELFKAKLGSPVTQLAGNITSTQTTIALVNADVLPAPPNIATIGTGVNAETIRYSGNALNTLTGVTRGFTGTAKAWTSGQPIARIFTQYDHDSLIDEVTTHKAENMTQGDSPHGLIYETGGFMPILYGGTTAGSPVYLNQDSSYLRLNNIVHVVIRIQISSKGGLVGDINIGGLPFASASLLAQGGIVALASGVPAGVDIHTYMGASATSMVLYKEAQSSLKDVDIAESFQIRMSMTYRI